MAPIGLGIWFGDEISASEYMGTGNGQTVPHDWGVQHHDNPTHCWAPTRRRAGLLVSDRKIKLPRRAAPPNRKDPAFKPESRRSISRASSSEILMAASLHSPLLETQSPTSPGVLESPVFQSFSFTHQTDMFSGEEASTLTHSSIATAAISLGVVFGLLAISISGTMLFNTQRRKARERKAAHIRQATACSSFSSCSADRHHQASLHDPRANQPNVQTSKWPSSPLIDRRSEWIRLGLDAPSLATSSTCPPNGLRIIDKRRPIPGCMACAYDHTRCFAHPSGVRGTSKLPPSPLGSTPAWTLHLPTKSNNEQRFPSRTFNEAMATESLNDESSPPQLDHAQESISRPHFDDTVSQTTEPHRSTTSQSAIIFITQNTTQSSESSARSPSLSSMSSSSTASASAETTTHETDESNSTYSEPESFALIADTKQTEVRTAQDSGDKSPPAVTTPQRSVNLQMRPPQLSLLENSDTASIPSIVTSSPLDQPSLLAVSFAALLSPHLDSILASASSASLFHPQSRSMSSVCTSKSMLNDGPLPPPTIMVSPPTETSIHSDVSSSSGITHLHGYGWDDEYDEKETSLIHSTMDDPELDLPVSGSWAENFEYDYVDWKHELADAVASAKEVVDFVGGKSANQSTGIPTIRKAPSGGKENRTPSPRYSVTPCSPISRVSARPSSIPVLAARAIAAGSP